MTTRLSHIDMRQTLSGAGFVYNTGERVLSTTSPLFAVLLSGIGALGVDIPIAANVIGCISVAAGGLCLWDIGHRWRLPLVAWAGALLYPTSLLLHVTLSSETPLYLALCLAAFAAYYRASYTLCALACGLAVLTRGDGILVAVIMGALFVWHAPLGARRAESDGPSQRAVVRDRDIRRHCSGLGPTRLALLWCAATCDTSGQARSGSDGDEHTVCRRCHQVHHKLVERFTATSN